MDETTQVSVTDSILTSVKKLLGLDASYDAFDADILIHINSVFSVLTQLGVGPRNGFSINDASAVWSDYITDEDPRLNMVKSYMYAKVRSLFDPPTSGTVAQALNDSIKEFEFRLNVQVDPGEENNE